MLRRLVLAAALAAAAPAAAPAQSLTPTRAFLPWETIETPHFAFHYPREMREWTESVARRMEAERDAVVALVGYGPRDRVHVVVDDPYNVSNGAAFPVIGAPAIYLWPVPPEPTSQIANNRSWGEELAVHEYAHVAHITRPSRNPRQRILWRLLPVDLGPIARAGSRWVWEGYATYVEGRLTGAGRPHGVWRAALLRQWALEGKLPTYGQLDAAGGYKTGSYAYLVGSAYLEWLAAKRGDSSLVHLWRRMTARRTRSFDEAFTGVFGDSPAVLYGRFTAEVTGKALRAEEQLAAAGVADGTPGALVQKLSWYTGDPAVSPDGTLLALQLRYRDRPGRVVLWKADSAPESEAERKARRELLARDPEDVPAIRRYPRPRRAVASLETRTGRSFESPRFLADGERLLVSRFEPVGDGTERPDLYLWSYRSGRLRRVTRGAAVRYGDPSPDGRSAVGVRCLRGFCDLVRVDLGNGAVTVLAAGSVARSYSRPRWSPDGRSIAYAVTDERGVWRVGVMDATGANARLVDPSDGVDRHSPSFTRDGRALVLVSEAGGVPNVERRDLATREARPLTRVTGAAYAPAPSPVDGRVWYLSEHATGLDLYVVNADSVRLDGVVAIAPELAPAAPLPRVARDSFAASAPSDPRPYGAGPRRHVWLPGGAWATDGRFATLTISSIDPAGRLAWTATGALGDRSAWRGGALRAEWRGFRPVLGGELFYAEQRPSAQRAGSFAPAALDADYAGATASATLVRDFGVRESRFRLGASSGALSAGDAGREARSLVFAEYGGAYGVVHGRQYASVALSLQGSAGRTAGDEWRRALTGATLTLGAGDLALRGDVGYGAVGRRADTFERFAVGGVRAPLVDGALLTQRVSLPAAPLGVRTGRELYSWRVALSNGGVLEPYYEAYSTRGGFADAFRVVGVDASLSLGDTPILSLPAVRALAGVGYTLDEPFRKKTRGYLSIEYRP